MGHRVTLSKSGIGHVLCIQAPHDHGLRGLFRHPQALLLCGGASAPAPRLQRRQPHARRVRPAAQAGRRPLRLPGGHAGKEESHPCSSVTITGLPAYSDTGYSDILLTVTLFGRSNTVTVSGEACTPIAFGTPPSCLFLALAASASGAEDESMIGAPHLPLRSYYGRL